MDKILKIALILFLLIGCRQNSKNKAINSVIEQSINLEDNTMEDMHDVFSELTQICKDHNYTIKEERRDGDGDFSRWDVEAVFNDFSLEQMLEGYYLETSLNIKNKNQLVFYDILDGTYSTIIFIEHPSNKDIEKNFKQKLANEVERLGIDKYKSHN